MGNDLKRPLTQEPGKKAGIVALKFETDSRFQAALRQRVDEFFQTTGRRRRDCWQMYLKSAILLAAFAGSYVLLVFFAQNLWQGALLAMLLLVCMAGIGFNIQHDGGHNAYSSRPWVNRLMAASLDLLGHSSYYWRWKHAVIHHRFVNITGYDNDISLGFVGRLSPYEPWRPIHRWQHLYVWPIYALDSLKLQLLDDLRHLWTGRIGRHRVPRPGGGELALFVLGKALFGSWAFVLPALLHPAWVVLLYYLFGSAALGTLIVLVFLMPHCNEQASFPRPPEGDRLGCPWDVHQAQATLNFARDSRLLTWFLGGLNYHKEHHLFPTLCHVNYPAIASIVEQTCIEFGIPYKEHPSFASGIAAHYRWLRKLGQGDAGQADLRPQDA